MQKKLQDILTDIDHEWVQGSSEVPVSNIRFDSRTVGKGDLFVAIRGYEQDGHDYIPEALEKGASCIVLEDPSVKIDKATCVLKVGNSRKVLAQLASNWFDRPSGKIRLIGVTGTNGKTTTATLLYQLFNQIGFKSGLLSTIRNYIGIEPYGATRTTPDPVEINDLLNRMVHEECLYCFMEVSSHAIHQHRISGLHFQGGVFTNISHEHLDYHASFDEYLKVKKSFFDSLPASSFALYNTDDKNGPVMVQNTQARKISYGINHMADFRARIHEMHPGTMLMEIQHYELWTRITGEYNAYNILAVFATARTEGMDEGDLLTLLSEMPPVEGRFETLHDGKGKTAIVDYAHTPDALENVLKTIRKIRQPGQKIITVVGAGGNRDKSKRPLMAQVAAKASDKVVLTSDNPRYEDPDEILKDMWKGVEEEKSKILCITDREEAIKAAIMLASEKDIVLVAGKGHEKYQEIKGERKHFDDREVIYKYMI